MPVLARNLAWRICSSVLLITFAACNRTPPPPGPPNTGGQPQVSQPQASPHRPHETSATIDRSQPIPILGPVADFELLDQHGSPFGPQHLRGNVWLAHVFRSRSSNEQSLIPYLRRLQGLIERQPGPVRDGIRLASITVDPETDTAEVLREFASRNQAGTREWKFLRGDRSATGKFVTEGLQLNFSDEDAGAGGATDSRVALIDRAGRLRGHFDLKSESGFGGLMWAMNVIMAEIEAPDPAFSDPAVTHIIQPPGGHRPAWLDERRAAQLATANRLQVFHGFQLADHYEESGIRFHSQIVDDQRWRLQVNHYDHGNGIVIADVDGDGHSDIYLVSQVGANRLFRNLGDGRFEDITEAAGVAVADRISVTASFADTDNDGDPDLFVTTVRGGNLFFRNDGAGQFTDISQAAGLDYQGHSSAGVFFDYDGDGRLDLFLVNVGRYTTEEFATVRVDDTWEIPKFEQKYYVGTKDAFAGHLRSELAEPSILYRNEGDNRFVDVTNKVGLANSAWSGDASILDANADGRPDLYLLNMQGHDEYYENVDGQQFVRKSRELFPRTPWGAMGIKVFDFDNDGQLDIYITDMHSDMSEDIGPEREKLKSRMQWPEAFLANDPSESIFGNAFYHNLGGGKYEEISDSIGAENYWPWGLSTGDLNADGYEDAFLTSSMCFPYRYGPNSLLLNNGGRAFVDSEYILGVEPRLNNETARPWFELDASGGDRDHPLSQGRTGKILVWSALGSRSSVIFDLDEDGDLDIVTNEFNSRPMVLLSNLAEQKPDLHFIKVVLQGTRSNRDGLGAIVRVDTAKGTYTKAYDGNSGYLSHSVYPLYFGLGDADQVTRIEVVWPSGTTSTLDDEIKINSLVRIVEPAG